MPSMPRIPGKGKKIAYKILGVPANLRPEQPARDKWVEKRLEFEETVRVR